MLKSILKNPLTQSNYIMYFLDRLPDWKSVARTPSLAHFKFSSYLSDCAFITNSEGSRSCLFLCALNPLYLGLLNQKILMLPLVYLPSISSRVNCRKCRGGSQPSPAPLFLLTIALCLQCGGWGKSTWRREHWSLAGSRKNAYLY